MDLSSLLESAQAIARDAGRRLVQGRQTGQLEVATKRSVMDVVTETDAAAERLIVARIRDEFPDDAILGEEGASFQGTSGRRWIVDPLDGTANFIHGWRVSAVSIGVEIEGVFSVGVVFNPFHDEMFTGAIGAGAHLNGERLHLTDSPVPWGQAYVGVDGGYDPAVRAQRSEVIRRLILEAGDVRIIGSTALALSYLAAGRFDAHSNIGSSIWDIAAGTVIAREAGYVVEGLAPGSEPTAERCLSARPELLDRLRAVVTQVCRASVLQPVCDAEG